ncbi:hypothetical protein NDI37_27265 [Funiculus sociatus GB2-A5]|uniref:Uncharacterized protein n=1 Tax=Funiculus sociatus GB2-A5 TaxID=2933946 RepID=A0ABV0JXE7_9CYAN|nr:MULTISPECIES: hypothetical protein [unclassified Trichocoleus]MBD1906091.1 hypothetical protein [Trichocoleus sp. FACHB-832]MBD2064112.1 hypothetical protein [Trichocoleus sp. FACHB-6]
MNKSKKAKWTTLLMIDSQAVKNICNASVESKSFWFYNPHSAPATVTRMAGAALIGGLAEQITV